MKLPKTTSRTRLALMTLALAAALGTWWSASTASAGCFSYACMSMPDGSVGYCLRCFKGGTP